MTSDKYVLVQMSSDDLYAETFDSYEDAVAAMEESEEKAYIIKIENICMDSVNLPFKLTLEPHT